MKNILLFGAGKSASVLIDYLLQNAVSCNWFITVADADKNLIAQKTKGHERSSARAIDVKDDEARSKLVQNSDLVISMMPPALHILVAQDCVLHSKHLLTASYADAGILALAEEVNDKGLIFLCEMGLDPGIDHMSAMQLVHKIKLQGSKIISFKSHCGGLVAPESDNNPWHYKISWNPKNVVLAGKAGAAYKEKNKIVKEKYEMLFDETRNIFSGDESIGYLSYYPNRNSLPYTDMYDLHDAETFLRTTLRHRDFMLGWKNIIELKLTDEEIVYQSDDMSIASFFEAHFTRHELNEVLMKKLEQKEALSKIAMQALAADPGMPTEESLGKTVAAHDINKVLQQLYFLGLDDDETIINKGMISAADGLQFAMEKKLFLSPADKDMVVMQHEVSFEQDGKIQKVTSSLIVKGNDCIDTAMAKTVGLPLGIAAKLILNGTINIRGIQLPLSKEIYEPVMQELQQNGIVFKEKWT